MPALRSLTAPHVYFGWGRICEIRNARKDAQRNLATSTASCTFFRAIWHIDLAVSRGMELSWLTRFRTRVLSVNKGEIIFLLCSNQPVRAELVTVATFFCCMCDSGIEVLPRGV